MQMWEWLILLEVLVSIVNSHEILFVDNFLY